MITTNGLLLKHEKMAVRRWTIESHLRKKSFKCVVDNRHAFEIFGRYTMLFQRNHLLSAIHLVMKKKRLAAKYTFVHFTEKLSEYEKYSRLLKKKLRFRRQ